MIYDTWLGRIWKDHMIRRSEMAEKWMNDLIHWHLFEMYKSEFVVIDSCSQHPDGLNFDQWLERKTAQGPIIEEIRMGDAPVSIIMRANLAPASEYADAMAVLEEIRDTHQEQIDKASAALLEAEDAAGKGMSLLLDGASVSVKIAMRLEEEKERVGELKIAVASLLGLIDALGGAGSLDDAGPDRKNLAELIDYPAILDEAGKDEELDCGECPFNNMCPDSDVVKQVPF